ncbi:unnamed protein product [Mytilus coruscus]|uniref:Uncharacterized protein n=1 Tax=Mytilus coruscus TaxID=42192 RepID=A0A6J8B2D6_MYTCO|nr:unnamed protein product [Mytilus coruscus]
MQIVSAIFTTTWKDSTMLVPTDLYHGYLSVIFTSASNKNATSKSSSWSGIFWCKRYSTVKRGLHPEVHMTQQSPTDILNDVYPENEYDEINEENINEDHMQHQDAIDISSNENSIVCSTDNDGYLKPDHLFISLNDTPSGGACEFTDQTKHQKVELNNCLQLPKSYQKNVGMSDNEYLEIINDEDDEIEIPSNFDNSMKSTNKNDISKLLGWNCL